MKFNKPIKIIAALFSSVLALVHFVLLYLIIQEVLKGRFSRYSDFVTFCGIFLALLTFGLTMLPIHTIVKRYIDKSKNRLLQKLSPSYLTIITVLRIQVLLAVFFISLATVPRWSDAMQYFVPVPVSEKQMKDWEKMISMGQAQTVYDNVTRLTNYKKRVNLVRLGVRNLKSVHDHVISNGVSVNMDDLNYFSIIDSLREINSSAYEKSTISKLISSDDLFKLLSSIALSGVSGESIDFTNDLVAIITNLKPDSPDLLQVRGDILWKRGEVCDAREVYKQYAESIRRTNKLASLPPNIQEIIDIKDKWNISYVHLIARGWIEYNAYSFDGTSADYSEPIKLGNRKYGNYTFNLDHIFHGAALENYLRLFTSDCKSTSIDVWEHVSSFKPGSYDPELQFSKVNPSFISWVRDHMIPSPNATFANVAFQSLYNKSFRNIARTYKMAHRYVSLIGIDQLAGRYKSSYSSDAESEDYVDGYNYLIKSFASVSFKESTTNNYVTPLIIGFWLRRHLDNSENSITALMDSILSKYDRSFLTEMNNETDYNAFTTISEEDGSSDDE